MPPTIDKDSLVTRWPPLPDPVSNNLGILPGVAAATWMNIAKLISGRLPCHQLAGIFRCLA
jgi:hypothetical protein